MQIKLIFTRKIVHLASFWKWGFLKLGSGLLVERWTWGGDLYNLLHWARRPRESRVDVHSLGLEYSCWYCRWHFYSKTPAIPVSRLPFVDIPYWDWLFFHRWNLWFCFISFEQSHRELSRVFVRFPDSYFTAGYPSVICDKTPMRTLSNEPLYEYTRRQLAAKPELTPKVQTWMRNVLLLFYRQLNNERAQTQGQDVRPLSDFILVSRSPKSSLFSRPWRW